MQFGAYLYKSIRQIRQVSVTLKDMTEKYVQVNSITTHLHKVQKCFYDWLQIIWILSCEQS